jgi:hypothetical protein
MAGLPFTIPGTMRPAAFCTNSTGSVIASLGFLSRRHPAGCPDDVPASEAKHCEPAHAPYHGAHYHKTWKRIRAVPRRHAGDKLTPPKHNRRFEDMADAKVLSNQKTILANQARIVKNQKAILSNQKTIVKNQKTLLANQGTIKGNQSALSEILKNQREILAAVRK